ncbi:MAG: IS110 family transposase, partial [Spirulinaceae cyanobacterium]
RMDAHIQGHEALATSYGLLTSITGIAAVTATTLLAEIGDIHRFKSARQLAAYAGLTPQERKSGTSLTGKTRLCKIGNSVLRKALYFPAITAARHCPELRAFYDRLIAAGKSKMQAIGAVMHKLIRIVFGVLKSGKSFDPDFLTKNNTPKPVAV